MPRHRDDDSGEFDQPVRKGGFPVWAIVLVGVVGTVLVSGCVAGAVVLAGGWVFAARPAPVAPPNAGGQGPTAPAPKRYSRDELVTMLKGKTQVEVKDLLGPPVQTSDASPDASWLYDGVTVDGVTGNTDRHTWVVFRDGKFDRIHH